jgi:tetratricopeptide (TPR) repeat protein
LVRLCGLAVEQGNNELALEYGREAYTIARKIGAKPIERCSLLYLARTDIAMSHFDDARQKLLSATAIAADTQNQTDWQSCNTRLAQAYLHLGQLRQAHNTIQVALRFPVNIFHHHTLALFGVIAARRNQYEDAAASFQQAITAADGLLATTPRFFTASYSRALAMTGIAILADAHEQPELIEQAAEAYHAARQNNTARGVLNEASRLLHELEPLDSQHLLSSLQAILS